VGKYEALLAKIFGGAAGASIGFGELCNLLERLGFEQCVRGSHHIFTQDGIAEILNLQPKGRKAKPYQVKQVRVVIVKYRLAGGTNGQ
jgi:predicted RNA binding protein YcfA (HicA-like mRNA interferase family)